MMVGLQFLENIMEFILQPLIQEYGVYGTMTATWRVATFTPGIYTFEMQADNVGTIYMDGVKLGSTQPYAGHNRFTVFSFPTSNLEPQIHEIKVEIENKIHRDGLLYVLITLKPTLLPLHGY